MESGLSRDSGLTARQAELYPLLERQVRLYTMGDSSSLPAETARSLLRSIVFTIQAGGDDDQTPAALFAAGQRALWQRCEEGKALLAAARRTDPGFGSIAHRDTLDAIADFFRVYDLRFFAHEIPCMIDYPLCLPAPESLEGIAFIGEYLRRLLLEDRFCGLFPLPAALRVLRRFQQEYRELVLNLFEPVFCCALGLATQSRGAAALTMSVADARALHRRFHPWDGEAARAELRRAVGRLCIELRLWDTAMRAYLFEAAGTLLPILERATQEGYCNLFSAQ